MSVRAKFPNLPFSNDFCNFMDTHPEFLASLKLSNPTRFEPFHGFILSSTPPGSPRATDQVIGIWYLDKVNLQKPIFPFFKQDFVVNVDHAGREFVSYAFGFPTSKYVRPIGDFFRDYGSSGVYYHQQSGKAWEHHYNDVSDLPGYVVEEGRSLKAKFMALWKTGN